MSDNPIEVPLLERLADFAHDIHLPSAPRQVTEQAALCLLDTVGCVVAGSRVAESGALFKAEVKGHGPMANWPQDVTARALGYLGDTLELNDLIGGHSSIGIVPGVLSATSGQKVSGDELLRAITAGTEVTARLYESAVGRFKRYREGGTVIVAYFNAIGAAAALSLLAGFDRTTTKHAMAIAGSLNSWCPAEVIFGDGGTIKPVLFGGNPAAAAIQAIHYAGEGLTGPPNIIESPIGMMTTLATAFDSEQILDRERWYITTPQRKMHAACGYTHSSIDAAGAIGLRPDEYENVETVDVAVPEFFRDAVGKEGPPKSPNDARFHLGYVVSLALQGTGSILPEHSEEFERFFGQESTVRLSEKVRIVPNDDIAGGESKPYNISQVTVRFKEGQQRSATCSAPIGSVENPMSSEDIINKFVRLVSPVASEETALALSAKILDINQSAEVSAIVETVLRIVKDELIRH